MDSVPLSTWTWWRAYAETEGWFGIPDALRQDLHAATQHMLTAIPYVPPHDRKVEKFLPAGRLPEDYDPWELFDTKPVGYHME